jgi:hypothetical protein
MVLVLLEQLILEVVVVAEAVLLRHLMLMVETVALVWLF